MNICSGVQYFANKGGYKGCYYLKFQEILPQNMTKSVTFIARIRFLLYNSTSSKRH